MAVFTGDLRSPSSAAFRTWNDYGRLWVQSMRWLSRRIDDRSIELAVTNDGGRMRISVDAERADGSFLSLTDARAIVALPGGETADIPLNASAPGRYDATMALATTGPYVISVDALEADTSVEHRVVRGWYWAAEGERRVQGPDLVRLARLAQMTGGRVLGATDSVFTGDRPADHVDISTWLIVAALLTFVFDIAVRRGVDDKRLRRWLSSPRQFVHRRVAV